MLNKREIIERVAAGLRRLSKEPDAMLWMRNDCKWVDSSIMGIPVFYNDTLKCALSESMVDGMPCVPLYRTEKEYAVEIARYCEGMEDA